MESGVASLEELLEILETKGSASLFFETNPLSFQIIKLTNFLMSLLSDYNSEFPLKATFSIYSSFREDLLANSVEKILMKMVSPPNELATLEGDYTKSNLAPILAKWWGCYLANVTESYQSKKEIWGDQQWISERELLLIENSLMCLEEHLHWKIALFGTLKLFSCLFPVGRFAYSEEKIRKYFLALLERERYSLEMTKSQNEIRLKEDANCLFRERILIALLKILEEDCSIGIKSLLSGRFDKKSCNGLSHSVVIGEDGGFYVLLNSLSEEESRILLESGEVSIDYLKACQSEKNKVVIGKGSFGIIRFGLALTKNTSSKTLKPGQIICLKKTAFLGKTLRGQVVEMPEIRDNALNDYSVGDIGRIIFSPAVYDMRIVEPDANSVRAAAGANNPEENKEKEEKEVVEPDQQVTRKRKDPLVRPKLQEKTENDTISITSQHIKGYTMQQFVAVYDGSKIFLQNPRFINNWQHQKAYFLDLFAIVAKLLSKGICMTDLKPENTLYDSVNFRGMLIDLAGVVRRKSIQQLQACNIKYIQQFTDKYSPKEITMAEEDDLVDLTKCSSYSLGIILKELVLNFSYGKSYHHDLKQLAESLKHNDPLKRITVEQALQKLREIGKEEEKQGEKPDFSGFVEKLFAKTKGNLEQFGMNPHILTMQDSLIDLRVSSVNPEQFPHFETKEILDTEIDQFFTSPTQVFILLGTSGSGKSTFLQKIYLRTLEKWTQETPLPIYLNLAVEEDIKSHWKWLTQQTSDEHLHFSLFSGITKCPVRLFIDSFDEVASKVNFVERFLEALGDNPLNKCVIACRSDFIQKESDFLQYFKPKEEEAKLMKRFILPLNCWEFDYEDYLTGYYQNTGFKGDIDQIKRIISDKNLKSLMRTSNMLKMTLEVFPLLIHQQEEISRTSIFSTYLLFTVEKVSPVVKDFLLKSFEVAENNVSFYTLVEKLGFLLAEQLFRTNKSKANPLNAEAFFKKCLFENNLPCLENHVLMGVVRTLDLQLEVKGNVPNERISLGFIHDSIKSFMIARLMLAETLDGKIGLLGVRSIRNDENLVQFLVCLIFEKREFMEGLKALVFRSHIKNNNNNNSDYFAASIAAGNALTLLVAANLSFIGEDLSELNIQGANLRDGVFVNCDFSNTALIDCTLRNIKLDLSLFENTILKNPRLGLSPDLDVGSKILSLEVSNNKREILVGCGDKTAKIFDCGTGKLISQLGGSIESVNFACFSFDYMLIVTGSEDGCLQIFEKSKNILLKSIFVWSPLLCGCFSPDNKRILAGTKDNKVRLYGKAGWGLIKTVDAHANWVTSAMFSRFGSTFLTSSRDHTIKLWESSGNRIYKHFEGHKDWVNAACFSPEESAILSGSQDKTVRLWDRNSGILIKMMEGHKESVTTVCFSHNGTLILSGSSDCIVKLWDRNSGNLLQSFEGKTSLGNVGEITAMRFSSDDRRIITGSKDHLVRFFRRSHENSLKIYEGHQKSVIFVAFSHKGHFFMSVSEDCSLKLWDSKSLRLLKSLEKHKKAVTCAAISMDDEKAASCSEAKDLIIWDLKTSNQLICVFPHDQTVNSVCFSANDEFLLTASKDKTIRLVRTSSGIVEKVLEGHSGWVNHACFAHKKEYIASASEDKNIVLWQNYSMFKILTGHSAAVNCVVFSDDDEKLISSSDDFTVRVWKPENLQELCCFKGHKYWVRSVTVKGRLVLSSSADSTVKIWDLDQEKLIKTLKGHTKGVSWAAFSPCGSRVISASRDNSIKIWGSTLKKTTKKREFSHDMSLFLMISKDFSLKLWDNTSQKLLGSYNGHNGRIRDFQFSMNDNEFVSGGDDKTIKLWGVKEKMLLKSYEGVDFSAITSVCFSPDGELIVAGFEDGRVRLFEKSLGLIVQNKLIAMNSPIDYLATEEYNFRLIAKSKELILGIYDARTLQEIKGGKELEEGFLVGEVSRMECINSLSSDETGISCRDVMFLGVKELGAKEETVLVQRGVTVLKENEEGSYNDGQFNLKKKKEVKNEELKGDLTNKGCVCCRIS